MHRGAGLFAMVIVTLAASLLIQNAMLAIWGPDYFTYRFSEGSTIRIGAIILTESQVAIIGLAVILMMSLHLLLRRTRLGQAMRATASNPMLARATGIRTGRIADLVWSLSGALSGIAGVVLAMNTTSFDFSSGSGFMIVVVAAAVLGGVGHPYGAMLGAVVIGLATELTPALLNPGYKNVVAFLILIAIILFRPQGLLGSTQNTPATQPREVVA
jgi:branched-subunit amino acid ABC-type transport system permease component